MVEIVSCFLIAIALSMDTFSLSLGLGTYQITKKNCIKLSCIVGFMHFLMPFLGDILGQSIVLFFSMNSNMLLGGILIFIAINLLIGLIKDEKIEADFSTFGMLLFAFGVSIDAFSTGLGLSAITNNKLLAMIIFSITSLFFTLIGLSIGNYALNRLGKKASIFGFFLLIILGIFHICQ